MPSVTDPAIKQLIVLLKKGGRPARAICCALSEPDPPRFGGGNFSRLIVALAEPALQPVGQQASTNLFMQGPDPDYLSKLENDRPPGSTSLVPRILSVFKRAWVIVVFGMALLLTVGTMFQDSSTIRYGAVGLFVLAVLVVIIDAFKHRCSSCKDLLAGQLLSIVQDGSYTTQESVQTSRGTETVTRTVNTHKRTWRCVKCEHQWSSSG